MTNNSMGTCPLGGLVSIVFSLLLNHPDRISPEYSSHACPPIILQTITDQMF